MKERDDARDVVPVVGDRVDFVIVQSEKKLLAERAEHPDYVERNSVPIDWVYYAEKQLMQPITALIGTFVDMSVFDPAMEEIKRSSMDKGDFKQSTISSSAIATIHDGKRHEDVPASVSSKRPKTKMVQATLFLRRVQLQIAQLHSVYCTSRATSHFFWTRVRVQRTLKMY